MLLTYLRQNTAQVVEYLSAEALVKSCRAKGKLAKKQHVGNNFKSISGRVADYEYILPS